MVSCLIHGENISHVGKPCCLFHFTVLWARVRMEPVRSSFIAFCCICFLFVMHVIDCINVIASCMIFWELMCFLKPLYRGSASMTSCVLN